MKLKLAEAIRLGSTLNPQTFFSFNNEVGTCAMGAAAKAVGIKILEIPNYWNYFDFERHDCPVESCDISLEYKTADAINLGCDITVIVTHLNDYHRWTREKIADWVETVEPKVVLEEKKEELVTV